MVAVCFGHNVFKEKNKRRDRWLSFLWTLDYNMTLIVIEVAFYFPSGYILSYLILFNFMIINTVLWTLFLDNMYMVRFYSHEAMKYCYITVDGILCIHFYCLSHAVPVDVLCQKWRNKDVQSINHISHVTLVYDNLLPQYDRTNSLLAWHRSSDANMHNCEYLLIMIRYNDS